MAVGIRMKSSTEGVTSQTLPLIASMLPVTTSPTTSAFSCGPSSVAHSACPGETTNAKFVPSTDEFVNTAFGRVGRAVSDRFLKMAEETAAGGKLRDPKILQKSVRGQVFETQCSQDLLDSKVVVDGPEGQKVIRIRYQSGDDVLPIYTVERQILGLAVNRLSNEQRETFFYKLRKAPDAAGRLEIIGQAVLDYARATATTMQEFEDSVDLYASLTSGAYKIDVYDIKDADNRGRMTILFTDPAGKRAERTRMIHLKKIHTLIRLREEFQCMSNPDECPKPTESSAPATQETSNQE